VAELFGGGSNGFALAGALYGVFVALPWLLVHRVSFERQDFQRAASAVGFRDTLRLVFANRTFAQLTGLYLFGRIAMDMIGALLILYFTYWIGRSGDFEWFMGVFILCVMLSLPGWLRFAPRFDKSTLFIFGSLWWAAFQLLTFFFDADTPRWALFAYGALAAIGYAVVDLMPWAMVGEAVDQDELESGERREGIYNGVFTFLRKLAGALAVFLVLSFLDLLGFEQGEAQTETVRQAIRWLTASLPVACLLVSVRIARAYPLTRAAHEEIVAALEARRGRS
jgi:Na+/melibiose symporter-like transporter